MSFYAEKKHVFVFAASATAPTPPILKLVCDNYVRGADNR